MCRDYNQITENSPDPEKDPVRLLFSYIIQYSEPPPEQRERILKQVLANL